MVTQYDHRWRSYDGVPIVEIRPAGEWEKEPVVLIGTVERYHGEIRTTLVERGYGAVETL